MTPRQIVEKWLEAFNKADTEAISDFYADNAVNSKVASDSVIGKESIRRMFATEFANAEMVCIPENIFKDDDWACCNGKTRKAFVN